MNIVLWFIFVVAAMLEVGGDAIIRRGLRGHRISLVLAGCVALCGYGLLVNSVKWDFSKLLGIYVGFFALVSVLFGWIVFRKNSTVHLAGAGPDHGRLHGYSIRSAVGNL